MEPLAWLRSAVVEPVTGFARGAPSPLALARSRRSTFEDLHVVLPSTVDPGEAVTVRVQARDHYERLIPDFDGEVSLQSTDPEASLPDSARFAPRDDGLLRLQDVRFETPGLHYLTVECRHDGRTVRATSNPVRVGADDERVLWGDLHLHSQFSDGAGAMERGFEFGRDVMGLDVVAYTDHDTMGFFIPPSLQRYLMSTRNLREIQRRVERYNDEGSFVTLFGYEWTKQPNAGGHVNCYFLDTEAAPFFDSRDPESDTYEKLWARLREWREETGGEVVTVPHHPAEAMYPFDFAAVDYDDELAPLVEVYSQWGSSEYPGSEGNPKAIGQMAKGEVGTDGHYARDALALGHRIGFVAGSDYHGPRPGHSLVHADPHLPSLAEWRRDGLGWANVWRMWDEGAYPGGLTAFLTRDHTRRAVFDALRDRQVYATTQPERILVSLSVGGLDLRDAESVLRVPESDPGRDVTVEVAGTAPLEEVEVLKNGSVWRTVEPGTGATPDGFESHGAAGTFHDESAVTGTQYADDRGRTGGTDEDAYYVRVRQVADGGPPGMAWAGPIWVATE